MFYTVKRIIRKLKRVTTDLYSIRREAPHYYTKWRILKNFFEPNVTSIETGTYLGETTKFLSIFSSDVISFEPHPELYFYNFNRFRSHLNIKIINSESQVGLRKSLIFLHGTVNFWLDGHFSGFGTYGSSEKSSPIMDELRVIFEWINNDNNNVANIAIDDARLFDGTEGYPTLLAVASLADSFNYKIRIQSDIILIDRAL